ncbi:MAG: hypothetical protein H6714_02940 [Myxococcales bacterium]|nr:hypothetical protein [Myxococcales bacterium]
MACALYTARFVMVVLGRWVAMVPLWVSAILGMGLMIVWAHRRHVRQGPVRVSAHVHTVPSRGISSTQEIIDTDGEVVEEHHISAR